MSSAVTSEIRLQSWNPLRELDAAAPDLVSYSRGFLRCRAEKWFPGFDSQWQPLIHAIGLDLKVIEIKPILELPTVEMLTFGGTLNAEPLWMHIEDATRELILEYCTPGAKASVKGIILEYIIRRLFSSLALSWSGPTLNTRFDNALQYSAAERFGIKLGLKLNGQPASIYFSFGSGFADILDALWRKQIRSTTASTLQGGELTMQFAELAVPEKSATDYLKKGTIVDLEVPVSDHVILRLGGKPWLPARLLHSDNKFVCEIVSGGLPQNVTIEDTARITVDIKAGKIDGALVSELSQVGASFVTDTALTDRVSLGIASDRSVAAVLSTYEGRFAVSVL